MKITTRQLAFLAGRAFVLGEARKPSEKKITEACPFEYTEPGTKEADRKGENGRRAAWLKGATEARADHVPPSKRVEAKRDPRAQGRHFYQREAKLLGKGYVLPV
jgi:hypothetical protein